MEPPPPAESQKSRSTSPTSSVASSVDTSNTEPAADGEYRVLLKSLDEESLPLPPPVELDIQRTLSKQFGLDLIRDKEEAIYGHPLTPEEAAKRMPPSNEGFSYHATIIPDEYFVDGKLKKGLNQRDFDVEHQKVKPRRPSLPITASDFFSSLTKVDGPNGPRYILYGILNGWPSLRCFELERLEVRRSSASLNLPTAKELLTGQILWKKTWSAEDEGRRGVEPKLPSDHQVCRAKLRGAPWTAKGWREDSPGFVFWYEAQRKEGPRVVYGTDLTTTLGDDRCTMIHMISHRYAVARETPRDRLTYHSVCLLEWEHGEYCTVVEAAYLNGIVRVSTMGCHSIAPNVSSYHCIFRVATRVNPIGTMTRMKRSARCTNTCRPSSFLRGAPHRPRFAATMSRPRT